MSHVDYALVQTAAAASVRPADVGTMSHARCIEGPDRASPSALYGTAGMAASEVSEWAGKGAGEASDETVKQCDADHARR